MFSWLFKKQELAADDIIELSGHTGVSLQRKNYPEIPEVSILHRLDDIEDTTKLLIAAVILDTDKELIAILTADLKESVRSL